MKFGLGLALLIIPGVGRSANADPIVPLVAGNYQIAQDFLHGNTHLVLVGDSIQNGLSRMWPEVWNVDQWSGESATPDLGVNSAGDAGVDQYAIANPSVSQWAFPAVGTSFSTISPGPSVTFTFSGTPATSDNSVLANRIYELGLSPSPDYKNGPWEGATGGNLHFNVQYQTGPTGANNVEIEIRNSATNVMATAMINTYSPTTKYVTQQFTIPNLPLTSNGLWADFKLPANAAPTAGSTLTVIGAHIYTGNTGFQYSNINQGGRGVQYFIGTGMPADTASLTNYLNLTDTNTAMIWLGQNDVSNYTAEGWQQAMEELIDEYKADKPGMRFILVSSYDTGSPMLAEFAQDEYNISQADSSVLFLNLYGAAGSFDDLNANYLMDGVHPNAAGDTYFANLTESLIEQAATLAPEPTMLPLVAVGLLSMRRSGRRRTG